MAALYIYADESGTMPTSDTDPPFVAAAVASFREPFRWDGKRGKRREILETISNSQLLPFIAILDPHPGFTDTLHEKLELLNDDAQKTLETTGANARLFPRRGLKPGNFIWGHTVLQAVSQAALSGAVRGVIDRIEILMDQKTLRKEERALFRHTLVTLKGTMRNSLMHALFGFFGPLEQLLQRLKFEDIDVSVRWSDDPIQRANEGALNFVDRVSRFAHTDIRKRRTPSFVDELETLQGRKISVELSKVVTSPEAFKGRAGQM
jgi:hypothetical protein